MQTGSWYYIITEDPGRGTILKLNSSSFCSTYPHCPRFKPRTSRLETVKLQKSLHAEILQGCRLRHIFVQYSRSTRITSREVFWDFRLKDLVWEWFGLLLWTSHLPKYQIQPWSHVKWPGWWLGTAIPMFPWGLNCQQLYPPPLGPPDRLSSRLNIFRL